MTWVGWLLVALTFFRVLAADASIGEIYTQERAATETLLGMILMIAVLAVGTGHL